MQENNKANVLVSFVIPCYNDAQYIEQSVNSALNQTYKPIEVIVVDDGSDEETKKVLKTLEPKITKLITQDNQGQSTARNAGINEANGDFIVTLDSDDFFEPTFCEKALDAFMDNTEVKLVSCYTYLLYENGNKEVFKTAGGKLPSFLCKNHALGSAMFRKKDWEFCGRYDENMTFGYEDWEFYIRLLTNGGYAVSIKEPLYTYRKRNNTTTNKANEKKYELLKYIYLKHQNLYKENFETFINHILYYWEREEKSKIKNTQKLEFRIGKATLRPFRLIKSVFK
ncbi:glycosyltransferase family 2 protein [Flavobacteriaceae bacterium XHP0103]|uniref:glycosyltransferase family 2 protein n=1 Tax=Marixanthotalea marina TaxID=2844359 RepID=UPI002989CD16|nr:glycosyltransferase family A protein [Marixanthotalea marina]MBU3822740.1 glycosyltransferase family 2 protein [Marixanthotalea marina]